MDDIKTLIDGIGALAELMGIMYTALIRQGVPSETALTMAEDMAKWLIERK